jgi:hypothetical protein
LEIGDGEPETRIGFDCRMERRHSTPQICSLLCLTVEGGGLHIGGDHATVVLDSEPGEGRLAAMSGLFWIFVHDSSLGLLAEGALR